MELLDGGMELLDGGMELLDGGMELLDGGMEPCPRLLTRAVRNGWATGDGLGRGAVTFPTSRCL
jgi:hypothetical protein